MDWRERTYYWVRLNLSDISWFKTGHDGYGKNYERRVRELKKIPELKMHPLPSMALAREKREKVPRWAQMLVSCRKAHDKTLVNYLESFKAEPYGYCEWERVSEPKKGENRKMEDWEKIKVGDLVRVLDGSKIVGYADGWSTIGNTGMNQYVGKVLRVRSVSAYDEAVPGKAGVTLYGGGPYTWDARGLKLVEEAEKPAPEKYEAETVAAPVAELENTIKEFKIRNSAGVLTAKVERELNIREVFYGIGDDAIPGMKRPRLEVHAESGHWGGMLVTLSDRDFGKDDIMYVIEIPADCYDCKPRAWLCRIGTEQPEDAYVTMEPWRE